MKPLGGVPWRAYLCLSASMALVGSYVGLSRWLVAVFPVFLLAWLRFALAAVAMLPWLKKPRDEAPLSRQDKHLLFWESMLGNVLFSVCMLGGVSLTSAVSAGVVMASMPAAVALLSWWWLGERPSLRIGGAIGLAVAGMAGLAWARHADPSQATSEPTWAAWVGHGLLLGAVLCEASYVVIGKRLSAALSPQRISALINLWGLLLITPLGLWQARQFGFGGITPTLWLLLIGYALAASVLTVWLWMKGLQQVPASRAGVFTVMLPIASATVGVLALDEPFTLAHALAMALSLAGLLMASWPPRAARA